MSDILYGSTLTTRSALPPVHTTAVCNLHANCHSHTRLDVGYEAGVLLLLCSGYDRPVVRLAVQERPGAAAFPGGGGWP